MFITHISHYEYISAVDFNRVGLFKGLKFGLQPKSYSTRVEKIRLQPESFSFIFSTNESHDIPRMSKYFAYFSIQFSFIRLPFEIIDTLSRPSVYYQYTIKSPKNFG